MTQRIKRYALTLATALMLAVPGASLVTVGSAFACTGKDVPSQVAAGASTASGQAGSISCNSSAGSTADVGSLAKTVVNVFSIIVGAASVIMIIYGGFRYITSGGDSTRVGNAKNTLIYAIVGLIIVALAQIIVSFVLTKSAGAVG